MHYPQILFTSFCWIFFVCVIPSPTPLLALASDPSTIDSLESISDRSLYFPTAQRRLAEIYLEQNTVRSRQVAAECIRKALIQNPDNLEFNLTHVKILYEQGFYIAAREACERILSVKVGSDQEYNRCVAEAYYYKGLIAERSALKYKDMISFVDAQTPHAYVSLSDYGIEDMKYAAACYEGCLQFESRHRNAMFHLALLYMEIQNYDRMARIFDKAIQYDPDDKEAYVYAAFAYYHLGLTERAGAYYQKALAKMSREEREVFNGIEYIVPPDTLDDFKRKLNAQEIRSYENTFWQNKDPLYLTTTNERKIEHYNRVAYANLRFSVPKQHLPGWKTERGKIYIRYGKPPVFYSVQPDIGLLGGAQMWRYSEFDFYFRDEYNNGNFLMDDASLFEARSAYHAKEELFELPKSFAIQSQIYQFKGRDGQTKLQAYFSADVDDVDKDYATFGLDAHADEGLFVVNSGGAIAGESRARITLNRDDQDRHRFVRAFELNGVSPSGMIAGYSLELRTAGDWRTAVSRDKISIRDFSGDTLLMSDIVLASEIRNDKIIPYFSKNISKINNVYLYFEIYNLSPNDQMKSLYAVATSIQPQRRKGVAGILHAIFGSGNKITSMFEVTGNSRDDRYPFALNIADVPVGNYDLTVQVTDRVSGHTVIQTLPITITEDRDY
jgi:GWxTD domain-containing protein